MSPQSPYEPLEYLQLFCATLHKRRRLALLVGGAIFISIAAVTFLMTPKYEAESSLLVKFGREFIYRPEIGDKTPVSTFNQEEVINSAVSIIGSRDLAEQVIESLGREALFDDIKSDSEDNARSAAFLKFRKSLEIQPVKKSSVINLAFQHKDPELAARALNELIRKFIARHLELHTQSSSGFFQEQMTAFKTALEESEKRLETFKQENKISSLGEQRSLLLQQRNELDASLKNTVSRVDEAKNKLGSYKQQMTDIIASKDRYTQSELDKVLVDSRSKLLALKLDEQGLSAKFNDDNPLLVTTRKQIRLIEQFLREQERDIAAKVKSANPAHRLAENEANLTEAELEALHARAHSLQEQMTELDREIQTLDLRDKELRELNREIETNEENFKVYQRKLEESRIQDEMNRQKIANIGVIQEAVVPVKAVKPRKLLTLVLAMCLALVSGVGAALMAEFGAQSFLSAREVERHVNVPVLASIPHFPDGSVKDAA
ncbi:MAG: GumC family protein [Bdellovibrionales bacterium]|nr:GumC family protein [Bdellovibrionales bacterium]